MTALDFPASPALYDRYTVGAQTWYWDGMTWRYGQGPGSADPNFANVSLLIHGDDGYTAIGGIAKRGTMTSEITPGAGGGINTVSRSPTQTKFGTLSLFNNGNNGYFSAAADAALAFGTGDFTLEAWYYPIVHTGNFWDFRTTGNSVCPAITFGATGTVGLYVSNVTQIISATSTVIAGSWHHIALCRASAISKLFVNGVQAGADYADANNYVQNGFGLLNSNLKSSIGNVPCQGYATEVRVTKGFARYTGAFAPPAARFPDR